MTNFTINQNLQSNFLWNFVLLHNFLIIFCWLKHWPFGRIWISIHILKFSYLYPLFRTVVQMRCKDCSIKFRSKHSSNTILCLLRNLMEQTLILYNLHNWAKAWMNSQQRYHEIFFSCSPLKKWNIHSKISWNRCCITRI